MQHQSTVHRRQYTRTALMLLVVTIAMAVAGFGATTRAFASPSRADTSSSIGALTSATSGRSLDHQATAVYTVAKDGQIAPMAASLSTRFYWGAKNGAWILTLNGLPVTAGQAVAVTATESDGAGQEFIGSASIDVQNVAVGDGWVAARVVINWPTPINVWLHYLA